MDMELVKRWESNKAAIRETFAAEHPADYDAVVKAVVSAIGGEEHAGTITLDPERIHCIDDGNYQGTLVFVIAEKGYQPGDYWYVKVSYGSCSGCDTLEAIRGYLDNTPDADQVDQYMTLALHIVQGLKKMGDECA